MLLAHGPACLFMCHIMLEPSSSWLWNLWLEMAQILCSGLIDGWLEKKNIEELAPNLLRTVPLRAVKQCTVADAIIYWSLMGF